MMQRLVNKPELQATHFGAASGAVVVGARKAIAAVAVLCILVGVAGAKGQTKTTATRKDPWPALVSASKLVRVGDNAEAALEIRGALAAAGDDTHASQVSHYLAARVAAAQGDGAAARAALEAARPLAAMVGDAFALLEVHVLIAEKREKEALAALTSLRKSSPKFRWAQADILWSRLSERLAPPQDSAEAALQLYGKSRLHLPGDELLARAARGFHKAGKLERGQNLWKKLLMRHPESDFVAEAERHIAIDTLTDAERLDRAELLFKHRDYERCRAESLVLWKKDYHRENVGYLLGKIGSERLRDDYAGAATYFAAAVAPSGPYAMYALASQGIVLGKLGRVDEAVAVFDSWMERYAGSAGPKRANEAMYDRCRVLHTAGRSLAAADQYEAYLDKHKNGIDWGKYWWFVAFWNYQGGAYEKAITQMARLRGSSNPLVGGKARYWTGKAQEKLKQNKAAAETMVKLVRDQPLNYYSGLAENWLMDHGHAKRLPARPNLAKVRWRLPDVFAKLPRTGAVEEIRIIAHLGEHDTLRDAFNDHSHALARQIGRSRTAQLESDLSDALEDFARDRGVAYGKWHRSLRSYPTAKTVAHWRAIYPRAYATHARWAGIKFGAPEWMVYAHMLQESRYKPWMISGAPAYGLLELLDRTARRLAAERNEDYQLWMLMVPGPNVRWGTQYLGALVDKFYGQIPFAVASYNGGPMLVAYHMQESTGKDFDVMIDDLGPHECRNYVRMVIGHFLRYIAIYETPANAAALRAKLLPRTWKAQWKPQPDY